MWWMRDGEWAGAESIYGQVRGRGCLGSTIVDLGGERNS